MQGKLIVTNFNKYLISAILDNNRNFVEINCNGENESSILGNIYIGKVKNIAKNINAAFIEFEQNRIGYYDLRNNNMPIIINRKGSNQLSIGDELIIQVSKDAIKTKEPVLTSNLEMIGKYSILTVNSSGISFSKKYIDKDKKKVIIENLDKESLKDFGLIIRTNALNADSYDILDEVYQLKNKLLDVINTAQYRTCYTNLYKSPEEYISHIRDVFDESIEKIVTDNKEIFDNIKEYLSVFQAKDIHKLEYYQDDLLPLYKLYNIEKCLRDIAKERVWLKSGAYLVIQPTEALVVIDVNSGKNSSNKKVSNQFMKINVEAAEEIAAQIRLRNLSGIIIVDFINMKDQKDKEILLNEFEKYLNKDRIKTTVVDITKLDLVEITRKKIRKPIYEQIKID